MTRERRRELNEKQNKRSEIETTVARLLLSNKLSKKEAEAVAFMVKDFHKMTEIEQIVG